MLTNLGPVRREKGISQEQLAAMVGQHASALSRYEHGRHEPLVSTALKIAATLGVAVEELADEAERTEHVA